MPKAICFPFMGDRLGGSHISTLTLLSGLDRNRWTPKIVVHQKDEAICPALKHELELRKLEYRCLPVKDSFKGRSSSVAFGMSLTSTLLSNGFALWRFLKKEKIDLLHTNDGRVQLLWSLPAHFAAVPHVWHQRTMFSRSRITEFMTSISTSIASISKEVHESLPKPLRDKSSVVLNPIEVSSSENKDQRAALIHQAGFKEPVFLIGTFGNLTPLKQPLVFAEMTCELSKHCPVPVLGLVCGDDRCDAIPQMRKILKPHGLENHLVFKSFTRPIDPWIKICDAIVACSTNDGFGRSIVEAQLLGVPVVAASAAGHKEAIESGVTGYLVEPSNVAAYVEKILALYFQPTLRAKLCEAGKRVADRYSVQSHTKEMEKLYERSLAN